MMTRGLAKKVRRIVQASALGGLLLAMSSSAHFSQGGPLILTHANVIDGVTVEPMMDATVIIHGGKIQQVARAAMPIAPPGATVMDLKGKYVLPGLMDAHVHINTVEQAQVALRSGVTTVRSMGVSNYADVGLRELGKTARVDLPEVLAAGYHVRPNVAAEFFLDWPSSADLMGNVRGAENLRRVVRANIERKVDWIKMLATERAGLPETDPRKRTFTDEEIAAIVDEARRFNIPVAAHAHGEEGAAAAIRAGVKSIEHGTYLSDASIALMKEKGTYLVPTIAVVQDLIDPGGQYNIAALQARGRHMLPRLREAVSKAWKAGVKIVAATDGGYGPQSWLRVQHDVEEMVGVGMTPLAAIQAATVNAAELFGISQRTGAIKPGLEADLIVIERNPLANIVAIQDVLIVINNGKVVVNRLKEFERASP